MDLNGDYTPDLADAHALGHSRPRVLCECEHWNEDHAEEEPHACRECGCDGFESVEMMERRRAVGG